MARRHACNTQALLEANASLSTGDTVFDFSYTQSPQANGNGNGN